MTAFLTGLSWSTSAMKSSQKTTNLIDYTLGVFERRSGVDKMFGRIAITLMMFAWVIGCAKAPVKPNSALCKMAESNAVKGLGQNSEKSGKVAHDEINGTYGCGITYQMMDEEPADEFDHDTSAMRVDSHHVAFLSRKLTNRLVS